MSDPDVEHPLFREYALNPKAWDELFAGAGPGPRLLPRCSSIGWAGSTPSEFLDRRTSRRPGVHQPGHHLLGLLRPPRRREDLPLRPDPPARRRRRSGTGSRPACVQRIRALNLFLHDVYHDQRILKEGVIPADLVLQSKGFRRRWSASTRRASSTSTSCGTDLIRDAEGEFLVLEDNGRTPVGRQLRAGKPRGDEEGLPAAVPAVPRPPRRGLSAAAPRGAQLGGARRRRRPAVRRAAVAGAVQLGLLRAQLPGPPHGHRAGPRARTCSCTTTQVYLKTTRGPAARRRDLPPARRRLPRPRGFRPDSLLGVPGLMKAYRAGQRHAGQRRRHRRGRRQGDLPVRRGHDPLLPDRGADPAERADLHLRPAGRPAPTSSTTSTSWWSRRSTSRAATAC